MNKAEFQKVRKRLGANIRHLRKEQGWSQEDLAFECGLHRTYIGAIERGEQNVSIDNITKIALTLGVGVGDLI